MNEEMVLEVARIVVTSIVIIMIVGWIFGIWGTFKETK